MGFLDYFKNKREQRSFTEIKQLAQLADVYGVGINENTSLRISAVYSSVNGISETLARVPLEVKQITEAGEIARPDHDLYDLLNSRPNRKQTSFVFRQAMQGQALLNGNGFAYILRNQGGTPVELIYLRSGEVSVLLINQNTINEEIVYHIPKLGVTALQQDMIWIPAFAVEGHVGLSPITHAATMLEGAYAAMQFNAGAYKKGGFFKGILTIMGKLGSGTKTPAERAKEIGQQFDQMYADGSTPVIYDGNTYTPLNMRQVDLQFVEYMRYTVEDIARLFNMPLFKLKQMMGSTVNSSESQQLEFVVDTMQPWYAKWENELSEKLLTKEERNMGYIIRFNSKMLLSGDTSSRAEYYNKLFYLGALSPDDIRIAEGMTRREGGDKYFSGVNLITQEQVELQTEKMKKELELGAVSNAFAPANSQTLK